MLWGLFDELYMPNLYGCAGKQSHDAIVKVFATLRRIYDKGLAFQIAIASENPI